MTKKARSKSRASAWRNFKRLWPYTRGLRPQIALYAILVILMAIGSAIVPYFSAKAIARLMANDLVGLAYATAKLLVTSILVACARYGVSLLFNMISCRLQARLQKSLVREMFRTEETDIDTCGSGLFIDRISHDSMDVSMALVTCARMLTQAMSRIGVVFATLLISWKVFVLWLSFLALYALYQTRRYKTLAQTNRELRREREISSGLVGELVRGSRDVKLLDANRAATNRSEKQINILGTAFLRRGQKEARLNLIRELLNVLLILADVSLGIILISVGEISVADLLIIVTYEGSIQTLVEQATHLMDALNNFNLAADRVFEIIDDNAFKKERFGDVSVSNPLGKIEFRHVTFGYKPNKPVIQDMSFKVAPDSKVAFVGKSGAGKTTILSLITKLYHRDSGDILIDGIPIDDLDRNSLRDNITAISQSPYIFNFTVRENLELAKPDATLAELRHACLLAQIDDHIMSLPDKYDTLLGENGVILSGGQKQRLAIARAILKGSKIILFDEATSALDNETQAKISGAIDSLSGSHTIVIVAHRLSTIVNADKIFVIENGRVVDSGTHAELLEKSAAYRELYASEASATA